MQLSITYRLLGPYACRIHCASSMLTGFQTPVNECQKCFYRLRHASAAEYQIYVIHSFLKVNYEGIPSATPGRWDSQIGEKTYSRSRVWKKERGEYNLPSNNKADQRLEGCLCNVLVSFEIGEFAGLQ